MKPARPRIVTVLPGFSASTLMDVVLPLLSLDAGGVIRFNTWLDYYPFPGFLEQADLLVFCRNAEPKNRKYLDFALSKNIPYIYDLDDNLFEVPQETELGRYYRAPERTSLMEAYLKCADLVRVYSEPLLARVQPLSERVELVEPPLHWSLLTPRAVGKKPERIKIVYVTSRNDDWLAEIFLPALENIQQKYAGRVEFYFWGYCPETLAGQEGVFVLKPEPNYRAFMKKFSEMGFDIGLAPLKNDLFHRSKTNNKFREYAACGIAGIYSNIDVYAGCVEPGRTGLLVENTRQDWQEALARLIEDDPLRERIASAAYREVRNTYSQEAFAKNWQRQIESLLRRGALKAAIPAAAQGSAALPVPPPIQKRSILGRILNRWGLLSQILKAELYNVQMLAKINFLKRI